MATPREIRRLAFQTLFQIDARGGVRDGEDLEALRAAMGDGDEFSAGEREKALKMAVEAYNDRGAADEVMRELAPTWPPHRQAAVDRAILRLAHYEMTRGGTAPKIAVNEAVELAKEFSTEKSPAFINGLLDKVLKRVLREATNDER
jgi:N utilization substance protein B